MLTTLFQVQPSRHPQRRVGTGVRPVHPRLPIHAGRSQQPSDSLPSPGCQLRTDPAVDHGRPVLRLNRPQGQSLASIHQNCQQQRPYRATGIFLMIAALHHH